MKRIMPGTIVRARTSMPMFSGPRRGDVYVSHATVGSWHLVLATVERLDNGCYDYTMTLVMPLDGGGVIAWAYADHMVLTVETT